MLRSEWSKDRKREVDSHAGTGRSHGVVMLLSRNGEIRTLLIAQRRSNNQTETVNILGKTDF
jgi:hypothetical protein